MGFYLFLLVNAALFVRPAEIVESLAAVPVYNILIVAAAIASLNPILSHFSGPSLQSRPVSWLTIGMLGAIGLSHLWHFNFWGARTGVTEFAKVVLYYLLLVSLLDSAKRLRHFILFLIGLIVFLAALAILQYHGLVSFAALEVLQQKDIDAETGEAYFVARLRSTGIFNDPNDLAMILVVGSMLCASEFFFRSGAMKFVWLGPIAIFLYGLLLTKSRGGVLALSAAVITLVFDRYGWKRGALLACLVIPGAMAFSGGRQADIGDALSADSGQQRVQFWSEGFQILRRSPLFGIGQNQFSEEVGHVAHNSFVHAYTELGLFGGTVFFGLFFLPSRALLELRSPEHVIEDEYVASLRPFLLAMLVGACTSMMSLSRCYVVSTYILVGLASVFLTQAHSDQLIPHRIRLSATLLRHLVIGSALFFVGLYVFTRLTVRYS